MKKEDTLAWMLPVDHNLAWMLTINHNQEISSHQNMVYCHVSLQPLIHALGGS